ncbi:MAG TPA: ankyrin repeat domain-containing protein [Cellvibrio sp.]|nr:ankyrin repeat domain-containing protein [Cellvibrio sp.]
MRKIVVALLAGFVLVGYVSLFIHVLVNQGIEELLICADRGGLKIPFSKSLCREYLFAARGTKQDVDVLHQGVGAAFVTQGESPVSEREQVLKYLIGKGLDVNRIDMHQLSPLHGAVLANSAEEVKMLLLNGVNINLKDHQFELTPLEFALKLQSENSLQKDRSEVVFLLENAK